MEVLRLCKLQPTVELGEAPVHNEAEFCGGSRRGPRRRSPRFRPYRGDPWPCRQRLEFIRAPLLVPVEEMTLALAARLCHRPRGAGLPWGHTRVQNPGSGPIRKVTIQIH